MQWQGEHNVCNSMIVSLFDQLLDRMSLGELTARQHHGRSKGSGQTHNRTGEVYTAHAPPPSIHISAEPPSF